MRRPVLLGLALIFIFCGAEARTGRSEESDRLGDQKTDRVARKGREYHKSHAGVVYYIDRGKRGRKYARRFSLRENLRGDKRRIYEKYGYTPHRLAFEAAGQRTERWKYYSAGLEFLFDDSSTLIEVHHFPPEDDHID